MNRSELVLKLVATDRLASSASGGWSVPCIHCGSKAFVSNAGETSLTLEHITPQVHGGDDSLQNLALACASCNQEKGRRHDWKRKDDPRRLEIESRLRGRRLARWVEPSQ